MSLAQHLLVLRTHTPVVEEAQVPLFPVVRVHILRTDSRPLQLIHQISDLFQIADRSAFWVQRSIAITLVSSWQGVHENLLDAARVYLEVELASLWVLPVGITTLSRIPALSAMHHSPQQWISLHFVVGPRR